MLLPVTTVADALYDRAPGLAVYAVGDCTQPRTALEAIHEARFYPAARDGKPVASAVAMRLHFELED